MGMDVVAAAAVARIHADDLRTLFTAVLRRRLSGAARRIVGGRTRDPEAQLPQLGPSHSSADFLWRAAGVVRGRGRPLMCRHLGWLGEPRSLASLMLDPPYSLRVQSYSPRRQKHGLVNADEYDCTRRLY